MPHETAPTGTITTAQTIITSCGIRWQRDLIEWSPSPEITGKRLATDQVIDFREQRGVFILYDGRDVVFVDHALWRGLGVRLWEHTQDALADRWDSFSWFGLLPVGASGELGDLPEAYDSALVASSLVSLLVQVLEPKLAHSRSRDLSEVEYSQLQSGA
jgi:hypothetical protein